MPDGEPETIDGPIIRDLLDGRHGSIHPNGLRIAGFHILGDVDLSYSEWHGRLEIVSCQLPGYFSLEQARISGSVVLDGSDVLEVRARDAQIDGVLLMRDGFTAHRGVRAIGLNLSGGLSLRRSLVCARPEDTNFAALGLYRATLGDLFLNNATIHGGLYAIGATVRRNVRLQGATVRSRQSLGWSHFDTGAGIALSSAAIGGSLYLWTESRGGLTLEGEISLTNAAAGAFIVTSQQLRDLSIDLEGFRYDSLRPASGQDILHCLDARPDLPRRGYVWLADHADRIGAPELKRQTFFHLERRAARARPPTSLEGLKRRLLGIFVGYGYRPGLALAWLALCIGLASALLAGHGSFMHRRQGTPGGAMTAYEAVGLAVDNLLPTKPIGVSEAWVVAASTSQEWVWLGVLTVLKVVSWVLAALWAASITGLIRRP